MILQWLKIFMTTKRYVLLLCKNVNSYCTCLFHLKCVSSHGCNDLEKHLSTLHPLNSFQNVWSMFP